MRCSVRLAIVFSFFLPLAIAGKAKAEDVKFAIVGYSISGNRLISADHLQAVVSPYTGQNRVFGDVQKALEAIEHLYKSKGYSGIQVTIPEQELGNGLVRMEIVEAVVSKVSVTGNTHFDQANILATLPSLKIGETPNARTLSENVQLANENPAKQVDVVLGIGEKDNELEARVQVKDQNPIGFYLTADNTGNKQTGNDRFGLALQHANLFNGDHVATLSYSTSLERPDRTKIYSASYRLPIYTLGDSLDLIFGYSDVNAGTTATVGGPLNFSGRGKVYLVRYNHILPRLGIYSHRFVYGYDQREYDNSCTIADSAVCGAGGADVTVRPASVTYSGQWDQPGNTTQFSSTLSANIPGGPHGNQADFSASRPGADKDYRILRGTLVSAQTLPGDWQLRGALSLQYAPQALVAGEQFGLVGSNAVRGFHERVVAVDKGYFANLEAYTPELAGGSVPGSLRLLAFFDFGGGSFNKTAPGVFTRETVSSAGLGMRYSLGRQAALRFDTARVINGGPEGTALAGTWRGHVNLSVGF